MNYQKQKNLKLIEDIRNELFHMPCFVGDFCIGIEQTTTPLTRINYLKDLSIFFQFIARYYLNKSIIDISLNDIGKIKASDIEKYLSYLSNYSLNGNVYSNSEISKARKLSAIRSLLKYLYNSDLITSNVASKVKTPKIRSKEIVRLETDEVAKLINFVENPFSLSSHQIAYDSNTKIRDVAILSLLLGTGIRVSECVGLNINDINLENNAFKITRKGGNQVVLYFSEEVLKALTDWLNYRNEMNINENENALFVSLQKKRLSIRAIQNLVKKYSKIISPLKKISPHKLRSTYGTNLYRETKDIYIVADVLGHKDVNTTKKHYAAISEDIRRDAANKVKLR